MARITTGNAGTLTAPTPDGATPPITQTQTIRLPLPTLNGSTDGIARIVKPFDGCFIETQVRGPRMRSFTAYGTPLRVHMPRPRAYGRSRYRGYYHAPTTAPTTTPTVTTDGTQPRHYEVWLGKIGMNHKAISGNIITPYVLSTTQQDFPVLSLQGAHVTTTLARYGRFVDIVREVTQSQIGATAFSIYALSSMVVLYNYFLMLVDKEVITVETGAKIDEKYTKLSTLVFRGATIDERTSAWRRTMAVLDRVVNPGQSPQGQSPAEPQQKG